MILPLEVNDPIQVKTAASGSYSNCESRVEEITADELLISWPTEAGERIPVLDHQVLTISFSRYMRVYEFDATVLDVIDDPIALLAVRPSSSLRVIQRRDDVRIRALAPVELTARVVGLARYKDAHTRSHRIRSETTNISAGGFTIRHPGPIAVGAVFEVKLTMPGEDRQPLEMSARVVRCRPVTESDAQPSAYDVGLAFTRIPEAVRARVVRFVFGAQREERLEE